MEYTKKQRELENMVRQPKVNRPVGIIRLEMVWEARSLYGASPFTGPEIAVALVK